jgi:uncharacterized coiled-coil protein SlyX
MNDTVEALRFEKDADIRLFTDEKEEARKEAESKIAELEALSKSQELQIGELRSQVVELKTQLSRKVDIESQLSTQRNRNV